MINIVLKKVKPYFVCLAFTIFTLVIHLLNSSNSMLKDIDNIENGPIVRALKLHKKIPFSKRPITSFLIEQINNLTNLELAHSFMLVSFVFYFLSGVLLFYLSKKFTRNSKIHYINLIVYYLCFSNIFSFFVPIYTYDEPIQFCFLFLSLLMFYRNKWFFFVIFFSVSLIARESGLLLLPGLFLIITNGEISFNLTLKRDFLYKLLIISLPFIIYLTYLKLFIDYNDIGESSKSYLIKKRFKHIAFNFQSLQYGFETIFSFLLVLGLPLYLTLFNLHKKKFFNKYNLHIKAFFLTVFINSMVVITSTIAREARLFVIPLFFLWPIFGELFSNDIKSLMTNNIIKKIYKEWKYFIIFLILNYIVCFILYNPTVGSYGNFFNEYSFFYILIIIIHFLINKYHKNIPKLKVLEFIKKKHDIE